MNIENIEATIDNGFDDELNLSALDDMNFDDEIIEDDGDLEALASVEVEDEMPELEAIEEVAKSIKVEESKAEAYAEQDDAIVEVEASDADKPSDASVEGKAPKAKRAPRATMAGGKKSEVLGERMKGETLMLQASDAEMSAEDLAKQQADLFEKVDTTMAKKVGEKMVNLLSAVHGSAKLSTYTDIALKFLVNSDEPISSADLKAHYVDQKANGVKGYSMGTASAQTGQMMQLLPALKIANVEAGKLVANEDSLLLVALASGEEEATEASE